MATKLKDYFPIIRERKEVLAEIRKKQSLQSKFQSWPKERQEELLDLCTGVKGLKLLYDGFFKEVMSPEYAPERLGDFLSCMLGQRVTVIKVLPMDSTRLGGESALLAMDIVVELADGSIANVEMQRIGYQFPGQRSACYSADLLLRQYKRIRGDKEVFNYRDVKNVYTIVIFEKSPKVFRKYDKTYYHFFEQRSDTGLEMELLQKYLFIPLDIFRENQQNRDRNSKRDAWLTLFSCDDPDVIVELLEEYPEFEDIYKEGYQICLNMERVMEMFSEELYILDRNTEKFMFEEMQRECEEMQKERDKMRKECEEMQKERNKMQNECDKMQNDLTEIDEKYKNAIIHTVEILRSLGLSDQEIMGKLCNQYQMDEVQAKEYL